jgi:hypothetical protein
MGGWVMTHGLMAVVAMLLLCGCNTTGLETPEASKAKDIVAQNCVVRSARDAGDTGGRSTRPNNAISIFSIEYGEGGWERYDAATDGVRGMIYYNKNTKRVACGTDNWRRYNIDFVKAG